MKSCNKSILYQYQEDTTQKLRHFENNPPTIFQDDIVFNTKVGIYADPAGSGKTAVLLNLIKQYKGNNKCIECKEPIHQAYSLSSITTRKKIYSIFTSLVIVHKNYMSHWKRDIRLFFPELSVLEINTQYQYNKYRKNIKDIMNYHIILINPNYCNLYLFDEYQFERIIIDIPFLTKCHKLPKSKFYWFIEPMYKNIPKKQNKPEIMYDEMKTIINTGSYNALLDQNIGILTKENKEKITIRSELSKINQQVSLPKKIHLYKYYNDDLKQYDKVQGKKIDKEEYLQNMKDHKYFDKIKEQLKCPICYQECKAPILLECCYTTFCKSCIHEWFTNRNDTNDIYATHQHDCPLCRNKSSNIIIYNNKQISIDEQCENILKRKGKFLLINLFPSFDNVCNTIMKNSDKPYISIQGKYKFQKNIDIFGKEYDESIIYLNWDSMKENIDLSFITDIILFHPISNVSLKKYLIGRAYRINRKNKLKIWNLVKS